MYSKKEDFSNKKALTEKSSKLLSKPVDKSLTEKELIDYTKVQEKILLKLREKFHLETKYPYSVVQSKADRLLKECNGNKNYDPKGFMPMMMMSKPGSRNRKIVIVPSITETQKTFKTVPPNKEEFVIRTQSFPRRWKDVELPIGLSTRSPSTEVHPPKSVRSSVTTMDSLPSEVSSAFYDQYSVNKYWEDGIYQKSVQPHFFFDKHVAGNYKYKPLTMNKKLVRPWPLRKNTAQDSFFKSRPRSPLRITQPGREDCSAFGTVKSRDEFLASLSACPIIRDELPDGKLADINIDVIENRSARDLIPQYSSSSSHTFLETSTVTIEETETVVLTQIPENNNHNIEVVENEAAAELEDTSQIDCSQDETPQDIPVSFQTSFPLALALIPLPWHTNNSSPVTQDENNNNFEIENLTVPTISNPILTDIINPEPTPKENEHEEIKPPVRKARGICSIVRLPMPSVIPTIHKDLNADSTGNSNGTLGQEKLTPKQSRLIMEIDQILSKRTNSHFKSTSSSKTETSIPSSHDLQPKAVDEQKIGQKSLNQGNRNKKANLLPSEKQMLSRLSGIFKRLDYDNANNVPPKLKKNTVLKAKTSARVPSLPKWPEWKFDVSLFPKAENLIAEAKELTKSSENEEDNFKETGTEFVVGMGHVRGNKLWEQSSNTSAFPGWFRRIPNNPREEERTLTSSKVAKRKDDLHPRKFTERKPGSPHERAPEILKAGMACKLPKLIALSRRATIASSSKQISGPSLDMAGNAKQEQKSSPKVQMKRKMLLKKLSATSH